MTAEKRSQADRRFLRHPTKPRANKPKILA